MLSTSRNVVYVVLALVAVCMSMTAACASESKAVNSMPNRLTSSAAYGIGIVTWGAVAQNLNGRAQLFTYEIRYGADSILRVCTERELHPGQKTFFAIKLGDSIKNKSCALNTHYIPANQFAQFIYAGFDDLIGAKTWFEVPSGNVEKFDCPKIDTALTSIEVRFADGKRRSDVRGISGVGSYFSDVSLMQCLKLLKLSQYKALK